MLRIIEKSVTINKEKNKRKNEWMNEETKNKEMNQ